MTHYSNRCYANTYLDSADATNPSESTFATVKLQTRVTKGAGSRRRGLVMGIQTPRRRPRPVAKSRGCLRCC